METAVIQKKRKVDLTKMMPHELLKQAPPFLFIDRIVEVENETIQCIKQLAYNEPYFNGHFPGEPIVPGVLMIEMAAQASMLLTLALQDSTEPRVGYLVRTEKFRFQNPVRPGDTLRIKVKIKERVGNYFTTSATLTIDHTQKTAAKGELIFFLPEEE
jgi:3-hydroxymyristoyl/3-hydroxydecanoyl-(acyl carrier protein) dehydratase